MKSKEVWAGEYMFGAMLDGRTIIGHSAREHSLTINDVFLAGFAKAKEEALKILKRGEELEWSIGGITPDIKNLGEEEAE